MTVEPPPAQVVSAVVRREAAREAPLRVDRCDVRYPVARSGCARGPAPFQSEESRQAVFAAIREDSQEGKKALEPMAMGTSCLETSARRTAEDTHERLRRS